MRPGEVAQGLAALQRAAPQLLGAGPPGGALVFCGSSLVGTLDEVLELWRWPSAQAGHEARQAASAAAAWRDAAAGTVSASSSYLHAAPFSPMQ